MTTSTTPHDLTIPVDGIELHATAWSPPAPIGVVVFVHGSGSSRTSPRNRRIAAALHDRGLAVLLADFMTAQEAEHEALDVTLRSDADVVAGRLVEMTDWIRAQRSYLGLPLVYVGSSTGAAAALIAAARRPGAVAAIVSRGGRPDLAREALDAVQIPTLFIAGEHDARLVEVARVAARRMRAPAQLAVIAGASHLFEERGALDEVARQAGDWIVEQLRPGSPSPRAEAAPIAIQHDDRRAAGRALGRELARFAAPDTIVIGLPRGGAVVAAEVARALGAPIDVWIARELRAPQQPELGIGALAEGPALVLDKNLVRWLDIAPAQVLEIVHREAAEIRRSVDRYRDGRAAPVVRARTVILVDDGIATGATIRAAARAIAKRGARRVVAAAPVGAREVIASLRPEVDELVCPSQPQRLGAVELWYRDFRPVSDVEVRRLLADARAGAGAAAAPGSARPRSSPPPDPGEPGRGR